MKLMISGTLACRVKQTFLKWVVNVIENDKKVTLFRDRYVSSIGSLSVSLGEKLSHVKSGTKHSLEVSRVDGLNLNASWAESLFGYKLPGFDEAIVRQYQEAI